MKFALILTLILLICLLVFSLADYLLLGQYENIVTRIEALPVIIFSRDFSLLHTLKSELEEKPIVTSLELEKNIDLLSKMITEYDLPAAEQILDIDSLPNMLEFRLQGDLITEEGFNILRERIKSKGSEVNLVSQEHEFSDLIKLKQMLILARKAILAGIIILLSLVTIFTCATIIRRSNHYWNIYYRSGGTRSRFSSFLLSLLIGTFLPLGLLALIFYLANNYLQMSYKLELRYWLLIGSVILFPGLLAWLITDRA